MVVEAVVSVEVVVEDAAVVVAVDSVVVEADAVETFNRLDAVVVDSMMTAVEAVDGVAIGKIYILDLSI